MPDIDVLDSSWIGARPAEVAAVIAQPANWCSWWPRLDLAVEEWRGTDGMRWRVGPSEGGTVTGSMEIWLEHAFDGVVVHLFLRLDRAGGRRMSRRWARRLERRYRVGAKALFWGIGDRLDPGRLARIATPRR